MRRLALLALSTVLALTGLAPAATARPSSPPAAVSASTAQLNCFYNFGESQWSWSATQNSAKGQRCMQWDKYRLVFQQDCNLVSYQGRQASTGHATWATNTVRNGDWGTDCTLALQSDGNIVIYIRNPGRWDAIWSSGTGNRDNPAQPHSYVLKYVRYTDWSRERSVCLEAWSYNQATGVSRRYWQKQVANDDYAGPS